MEKHLPQNIEAECGVLGSIIIDPEAIVQVADFLHTEDFYRDAHRIIYETILSLYEQHEAADYITICDELERQNKLEAVGGPSYITSLINLVPTSGNVEYYAHIVERTRRDELFEKRSEALCDFRLVDHAAPLSQETAQERFQMVDQQ